MGIWTHSFLYCVPRFLYSSHVSTTVAGYIRSDNGSEFITNIVQVWLKDHHIKTIYIDPATPWKNGYIERFHSRCRDECLNREWLLNLREDPVVIEDGRQHYNTERPHSRLGYLSRKSLYNTKTSHPKWANSDVPLTGYKTWPTGTQKPVRLPGR